MRAADFKPHSSVLLALMFVALLPASLPAQSLWKDDSKSIVADKRATSVGDIITIIVQESTDTSKGNKTETAKKSSIDASIQKFITPGIAAALTQSGQLPALAVASQSDFSGGDTINNSEKIIARIAVRVIDVLPNRNLVIEGTRETAFSGEKQTAILRGIVRPEDVAANNTVFSYNVADAKIQSVSKGTISDAQRKGWFHKLWDKISPF